MNERLKFPAWLGAFGLLATILLFVPNAFVSFMLGVVGGGMIAFNAGEQLRKDQDRRTALSGGGRT